MNKKTISDAYLIPNINEIIDQLGGAKYFSILDLASGFHQIPMREEDKQKTAFSTPYGHYHFTRMPFGLKNSPATFQRQMDTLFRGLQDREVFIYVDDCIIFVKTLEEHDEKFKKVAERLGLAGMRLQPDKCEFYKIEVAYLGHIITPEGVLPDPRKINAIVNFPTPKDQKTIRQLLGLTGYYRKFIAFYARETKPLSTLLRKDVVFYWKQPQQTALDYLKHALTQAPLLRYQDFAKPFIVTCDASGYAIGAVLSQLYEIEIKMHDLPVAYFSCHLKNAELNYSTIEKELLAMVAAAFQFRYCLFGRKFTFVTDHKPLIWVHNIKDPTSRLKRFYFKLREFDYEVVYKEGKTNYVADALSRNPTPIDSNRIFITESSSSEEIFTPRQKGKIHGRPPDKQDQKPGPSRKESVKIDTGQKEKTSPGKINIPQIKEPQMPSTSGEPTDNFEHESDRTCCENSSVHVENDPIATDDSLNNDATPSASLGEEEVDTSSHSSAIIDDPYVLYDQNIREISDNVTEIRDSLFTHRDNIIYFVTARNEPLCSAATEIAQREGLPPHFDADPGTVKTYTVSRKTYFAVTLKEDRHSNVNSDVLNIALNALATALTEKNLKSVRFSILQPIDNFSVEHLFDI